MIETLISSKTRIKLLLKFFINSNTKDYLRSLEEEFNESTNSIRIELNRLESAQMLKSSFEGNKKYFQANVKHPLFGDIQKIVLKHIGLDEIITNVANNLGYLERVYLTGSFVQGIDSNTIDLIMVGDIDENYLRVLVTKSEKLIKRKVKVQIVSNILYNEAHYNNNQLYILCYSNN